MDTLSDRDVKQRLRPGVIGLDLNHQPIYIGSKVAWGVKGGIRLGHVTGFEDHAYRGYERQHKGGRQVAPITRRYFIVTTTQLPQDERRGHGGKERGDTLVVIPETSPQQQD